MDKNMIHIDDLIRQRLNGEEEERAGAWLRMKDLLDKNIPTKAPAAFNWRRMFTYAALVAAVATVGIGGYEYSSASRTNDATESRLALNTPAQPGEANTAMASSNSNAPVPSANTDAPDVNNANNTTAQHTTVAAHTANSYTAKANNLIKDEAAKAAAKTDAQLKPADHSAPASKNTFSSSTVNNNTKPGVANNTPKNNSNNSNNSTQAANTPAHNNTTANTVASNDNTQLPGNERSVPTGTPVNNDLEMAMINTISQNKRIYVDRFTGVVTVVTNEVGRGKEKVPTMLASTAPAVPSEQKEPLVASNTPVASAPPVTAPPPPASNGGTNNDGAHRNSGGNSVGTNAVLLFKDAIDKAKYQLGHTTLHTGLVGGINTTFGNYDMRGFNVGFFGLFTFADGASPWSVMLQARYMQFFNNRINTYSNNYTSYKQGTAGQYAQEEKEHYFKYSTASRVNVPLMLQYTPYKSKFTIFAGADFNYFFNIKAEETERTLSSQIVNTAPANATPLTLSDFSARFGAGAVFGVGYDINGKMRLDMRVSQSMWDNAKGTGAQQISKDLYKTPNVQLNLGVRLGKEKKD